MGLIRQAKLATIIKVEKDEKVAETTLPMVISITRKALINTGNFENITLGVALEIPVPVNLNADLTEKLNAFKLACVQIAKTVEDELQRQVAEYRI
jgi:hypothetical protein